VIDQPGADNSTLVETPENAPKPRRNRNRRPRKAEGDAPEQDARRCVKPINPRVTMAVRPMRRRSKPN
jgi:hypothetical protein